MSLTLSLADLVTNLQINRNYEIVLRCKDLTTAQRICSRFKRELSLNLSRLGEQLELNLGDLEVMGVRVKIEAEIT
jgi:hypothetical protein